MRTKRIISTSLIISSLSYLSIEFISILKSKAKLKGYFHTISELSTPIGERYSSTISNFSPLSNVFNTILIINGIIYFIGIGYYILKFVKKPIKPFLFTLSCITGLSTILVGFFHSTTNPPFIHYASSALVFFCGNLLIFILGIIKKRPFLTYMSIIGVGSTAISFLLPHSFYGLAERMGIYSLIIFEFITGLEMLKISKNKYLENA